MSSIIQEFEARCRDAIRGAMFFGQPVKDMDAESLLVFAGHLASENTKLRKAAENAEVEKAHDWLRSLSPPRWIPVAERLPDCGTWCWVWWAGLGHPFAAMRDSRAIGGWTNSDTWEDYCKSVTHWMPLPPCPSPPKEPR